MVKADFENKEIINSQKKLVNHVQNPASGNSCKANRKTRNVLITGEDVSSGQIEVSQFTFPERGQKLIVKSGAKTIRKLDNVDFARKKFLSRQCLSCILFMSM